jgi:hypothetical protein
VDGAARTLAQRLRAQGLTGRPAATVEQALGRLVGVQAQDLAFARLAFRPRCSPAVVAADVDAAVRERRLVWTWAMRGTLHLVRADDAHWLLGLLGPSFAARGRPRRLRLGLDDDVCARALDVLRDVLTREGTQTRRELVARLPIDPDGQAGAHLLAYAALRGVICRGPPRAREPTYALLDDWIGGSPAPIDEDGALAQLARRYLAGHGPAAPEDLARWSGAGLRRARRAFELVAPELREAAGGWLLASSDARPGAGSGPQGALLGHFDPYLLGYTSRDLVLDARNARRIQAGGGFVGPAVVVEGRVVGTWRRDRDEWLELFERVADDARAVLAAERADVERFLAAAP